MKERDFEVGERVGFKEVLIKDRGSMKYNRRESRGAGVLMGFRTIHDMKLYPEDGYYRSMSYRVALVVDDLYTVPNKVPVDHFFSENPRA
jgi:hypothetical protein